MAADDGHSAKTARLMRWTLLVFGVFALACTSGRGTEEPRDDWIDEVPGESDDLCGNAVVDEGEDCDPGADGDDTTCGCQPDCAWQFEGFQCNDADLCTTGDACDGAGSCASEVVDCDDDDVCTTDSCDEFTGECLNEPWTGEAEELYDMELLSDPSTLDVEFLDTDTVWVGDTPVEVAQIAFTSYQSTDCEIGTIRLEGYLAATGSGPGLVIGSASGAGNSDASIPAVQHGLVVLAYASPGLGASAGTPNSEEHLADLDDDPRDSWYWEDSVAAIRAITLLEDWVGVDDSRLGVWGHSGSDVGAGLAAGVDSRISLAVIEPSFPDLGESQERFEETLIMDAAVPTFVLGSSDDLQGTASVFSRVEPDGRLLIDGDSAFRFWIEGRWELDYGFYNVPDHPHLEEGEVILGDTTGYTVLGSTVHDSGGMSWATVVYESAFGETFQLSSTPTK